jgi:4-amino-4-deoxy-L-arabinose transferase-like glycosyltransferase
MFEKPPLKLWLGTLPLFLLGESNFSFRIVDGLLGILWTVLTIRLGIKMFGFGPAVLCAALLPLGVLEVIDSHHGFRRAVLDGLLCVLVLGAAGFGWQALNTQVERARTRALLLASGCCALAVLTKSVAGFVPLLCVVGGMVCGISPMKKGLRYLLPLSLAPVVFVVYVAILSLYGAGAVRTFLGVEVLDRVITGFAGHNTGDPFYYVRYFFLHGGAAPGVLLTVGTLGALIEARGNVRFRYLLVWAYLPLLLFSTSASKVPWYLAPYIPFMALIAVFGTTALVQRIALPWIQGLVAFPVLLVAVWNFEPGLERTMSSVKESTARIGIDRVVESLSVSTGPVFMVNNAISGRSKPIRGRFNVEGIYREMLRPRLSTISAPSSLAVAPGVVAFVKEEDLSQLPPGWVYEAHLSPHTFIRPHAVAVVRYPDQGVQPGTPPMQALK